MQPEPPVPEELGLPGGGDAVEGGELAHRLEARTEVVRRLRSTLIASEAANLAHRERIAELVAAQRLYESSTVYLLGRAAADARSSLRDALAFPWRALRLLARSVALRRRARRAAPVRVAEAEQALSELVASEGAEACERWVSEVVGAGRAPEARMLAVLFDVLAPADPEAAIRIGERLVELEPARAAVVRELAALHREAGNGERAEGLLLLDRSAWITRTEAGPLATAEVETVLSELIANNPEGVEGWSVWATEHGGVSALELHEALFELLGDVDPVMAVDHGRRAFDLGRDPEFGRRLASRYQHLGRLRDCLAIRAELPAEFQGGRGSAFLEGHLELLDEGFAAPAPIEATAPDPVAGRVMYLLHNSRPYSSGGYATRSHGLAAAVRAAGADLQIVTRLGFPLDLEQPPDEQPPGSEQIEGVPYHRLLSAEDRWGEHPPPEYLRRYCRAAEQLARELAPAVVHAASNYMNGIAANHVARALGVASVYEVRGLWELTHLSRDPLWEGSDLDRSYRRMETQAALDADAVIAITGGLRDELTARGVPAEKIRLVPNAVDADRFVPGPRDAELAAELGLSDKVVVGYIGSVVDYEGLDDLVEAVAGLRGRTRSEFGVLVVGDGGALEDVRRLARAVGVGGLFRFTGRVRHREVERYYSLIDVMPYPRRPLPVCELVSPIKPFEAMAMEKAVVASDVGALAEIVDDGVTGLLHRKGDVEDLAAKLGRLIDDPELRHKLGRGAREWVITERSWSVVAGQIVDLYGELAATPSARKPA